uniref:BHLH domain-containing protein n=1 Tax=Kalanchoe fedtschenkoi TaxID=63787 RepID=A0A7N0U0E0_KALFE
MMEHKRSLSSSSSSSVNPVCLTSIPPKRHKPHLSISTKEKKDKFGERIAALQQLVSPYGKTDTASVLTEAMEYIQFLHDQVKVLSAPYLQSTQPVKMQMYEAYNMRSRGLCLVPVSCTVGVASSNGADIWAPIKSTSPRY